MTGDIPGVPLSTALIERAYAAYNRQDAEALLALVSEEVDWPNGLIRLRGKQALAAYWVRQWARTRTHDEVLAITAPAPGRLIVRIAQTVRALSGDAMGTGLFEHDYLIEQQLIARLEIRRL